MDAIARGAADYLAKPVDVIALRTTVARALERRRLAGENQRLRSEAEIECAIDTILTFAFGRSERLETYVFRVRAALPQEPTVLEIVDAVFAARREMGPITDEAVRRADAGMAMAAFLFFRADEMAWPLGPIGFFASVRDPEVAQHRIFVVLIILFGLPAAMFRVGSEVWLTPAREALS